MKISEMFVKPIDRDIKGVIKVGQEDDENVRQELEEYVVTRELQKHFRDFASRYADSIGNPTDKMGVWISGFFGSGKSHFLKIWSYLLSNREVEGKRALDYFIDDSKIADEAVLADMRKIANNAVNTDVILFNIDSKSEVSGKKDGILAVFLKVFNEMQGYFGPNPHIADLERRLCEDGKYDGFKERVLEKCSDEWEEVRNDFDFSQDDIVEVLSEMGFMSVEAARNWCEKTFEPYTISIESFAKMVKKYIAGKGKNHRVVFLVDEIGQYIGDNSDLMLNLQTVTEDLGTACGGNAWIIVTSQQDIDSITRINAKIKGDDFSKIQGRFDTRISLSSANVDEVIRKRILEKNPTGRETLGIVYEQKNTIIKNLVIFDEGATKKLYADKADFTAVYPFIPYQFNLLGSVLTSIRTHGASGKHLAEGERSMIALFKESAARAEIKDNEPGVLVPFSMFYDALEQYLDHSHSIVISRAYDIETLNPEHAEDSFDINVLKALFMIKYVKEMPATLGNITSLMVSHIDDDRVTLEKRVEGALSRLVKETLIEKSGSVYTFLTDEEQEINREIARQPVENSELVAGISEIIFTEFYDDNRYRYDVFGGRYSFTFNQVVDDRKYKNNQNYEIELCFITPYYGIDNETQLALMSSTGNRAIVALPENDLYTEEISSAIRIDKFLRLGSTQAMDNIEKIKPEKNAEKSKRMDNARILLQDALKNSAIYVGGSRVQIASKDIKSRLNEAMHKLVEIVYNKLSYIEEPHDEPALAKLIKERGNQISLGDGNIVCNRHALDEMYEYIGNNSLRHTKTTLKTLLDRYTKAPYGFMETDVRWLVARLYKNGDITMSVNNEPITRYTKSDDDMIRYLTRREFVEKLTVERRERANEKQKKAVAEVMRDVFSQSAAEADDDAVMRNFQKCAKEALVELETLESKANSGRYPGKNVISAGKSLMKSVAEIIVSAEFFKAVDGKREDFLDFAEDYAPVRSFYTGEQVKIFDDAIKKLGIYDESKTFIVNAELEKIVAEMKDIVVMPMPYNSICRLPGLIGKFNDIYIEIFEHEAKPVRTAIEDCRARVFEKLDGKECKPQLEDKFVDAFRELREKCETCDHLGSLMLLPTEADALKMRCLNEIDSRESVTAASVVNAAETAAAPASAAIPRKKRVSISAASVAGARSWQIETERDVEKYVAALRAKLMEQLRENTIINIEF